MNEKKASQQQLKVEAAERRKKVLTYVKAGASNVAIAQKLGVSEKTIRNDIKAVLKQLQQDQVQEATPLRTLWKARLDQLLSANWENAVKGVPAALEAVFRILEKEQRLFGLDAAVKIDVQVARELANALSVLEKGLTPDEYAKVLKLLAFADGETGEAEGD